MHPYYHPYDGKFDRLDVIGKGGSDNYTSTSLDPLASSFPLGLKARAHTVGRGTVQFRGYCFSIISIEGEGEKEDMKANKTPNAHLAIFSDRQGGSSFV